MSEAVLSPADSRAVIKSLLGGGAMPPHSAFAAGATGTGDAREDMSVAGVMLLSAMSVLMAILGMVTFALFVIGCWWLVSHVPVPAVVHQFAARLHLT